MRIVLLSLLLASAAAHAETRTIRPHYARPEDIETVVSKLVPAAGVAAVKAQNSVLISGTDDVLDEVERVVRELDQPGQVVELEVGLATSGSSADSRRGLAGSFRGAHASAAPVTPASEALEQRGASSSNARQSLVAMAGRPAEVTIGDAVLVSGGPLAPPTQIQTGKRIAIDGLRVVEDGKGVEMDVQVEDTTAGAAPVVSSGTRAKTSVRLMLGQTQVIASVSSEDNNDSSSNELSAPGDKTATAASRRLRARKSTAGEVTITLRAIR